MNKFTKYAVAMIAGAGLLVSAGCKSDCEKAWDNMTTMGKAEIEKMIKEMPEEAQKAAKEKLDKEFNEDGKKKFMEECKKQDAATVKCAAEAKSMEDFSKCDKKEEKK